MREEVEKDRLKVNPLTARIRSPLRCSEPSWPAFLKVGGFQYREETDTMLFPAGHYLRRDCRKGRSVVYPGRPEICGACPLKPQCTQSPRRLVKRHLHDAALQRMNARATLAVMRLRGSIVEHPSPRSNTTSSAIHAFCCEAYAELKRKSAWR